MSLESPSTLEERNVIRILNLMEEIYNSDKAKYQFSMIKAVDAMLRKKGNDKKLGVSIGSGTLRIWTANFGGSVEQFDMA